MQPWPVLAWTQLVNGCNMLLACIAEYELPQPPPNLRTKDGGAAGLCSLCTTAT